MNKFFIASAIALSSLAATTLPSQAQGYGPDYHHHHYPDYHHRHCFTKVVKEWHHGHRVVREEHVCR
ncbi:hypothetical protein PY650_16270 [Rhizobium calliandrae]|uniref:Uncharacterized protein n=1 Tax=Rhizobium calliandrae TaxID=1312182 RepID=A0ABT7KJ19_9HYPH|nr:hypothetical protein [Rhizobium calliandrae]MDL2407194.1 hypothetical protein [Rhizobium calliandrae]